MATLGFLSYVWPQESLNTESCTALIYAQDPTGRDLKYAINSNKHGHAPLSKLFIDVLALGGASLVDVRHISHENHE